MKMAPIIEAMNKGLQLVSGDVVGILNADDFYAGPEILEKVANAFADKRVDSCYGDLVYVKEKRRPKVEGQRLKGGIPEVRGRRSEVGKGNNRMVG
jgi:glycosyltransferase involved in cell wall biosynthesis